MGIFQRLKRVFNAEANAAVDTLENNEHMADQILRELNDSHSQALEGAAEIKAIALGHRASETKERDNAKTYEKKANDILDLIEAGKIDPIKGTELANSAAESSAAHTKTANEFAAMAIKEEAAIIVMNAKIKNIKDKISETANRINLLKARSKTAAVSEKINKTLSSVDTDGLMATMDRIDQKVTASEFKAQAYAEVDDATLSTDQEINKVLSQNSSSSALEAIKAKRATKTTA